jgi:uncharacterized protein (DUF427 family)
MTSYIDIKPEQMRVRVTFRGEAIAETAEALALKEGSYPVVYYIPRKDVKMDRLVRTTHSTHCPHKGDASYFSIQDGPANAVWSYERPKDGVAAIREHLAFYPDKVDAIEKVG